MKENTFTIDLITILGIINLSFSSIVMFFFFIKKAPLLLRNIWLEWWYLTDSSIFNTFIMLIIAILKSIRACLLDFDFVYNNMYMVLIIIGLVVHPFFFGILTLDFLRTSFLKNVVAAVWKPRMILMLTFIVFLLTEYYFTIIAYIWLYDNFKTDGCPSLWRCYISLFDYTFKATGSAGGMLVDPHLYDASGSLIENLIPIISKENGEYSEVDTYVNMRYLGRFFFDNFFKFIL